VPIRKRLLSALTLSSTIYLVPVFTAHWIDLFGLVLGRELFRDRELAWKAADVAFALILQAILFACVWWVPPRSKAMAVGVTVLLLIPGAMVLNFAYLYAIPSYFLVERDTTPDTSAWREECAVEGFSLDPVRQGISRGLERRGEAWVRQDNGTQYGILRVPGCAVEPVAIPELPIAPGLQQALPDGSVLYVTMERGVAGQQYWLLRRGSKEASRLEVPEGQVDSGPLVAEDGGWVAWVTRSPDREASLRIEPLGSGQPIVFSHPLLQRTTLVPVELDMKRRQVIVNRDLSAFAKLRLDGTVEWGPLAPGAIAAQNDTFRYLDGQWAAWDAYVENARYRLGWSTQGGKGQYEAPKGRSITSAAMDARGRYVAASTTTALSIGSIKDTVVALRTGDGSEAFRRTLPTYARSQVAFLGDGYFAYSEINGARSLTRVLRIDGRPASTAAAQ
jgi:hypothetical protein